MHSRKQLALLVVAIIGALSVSAGAQAKKKPRVFFIEPKNGAQVTSPVHMKFGSEGIEIAAVPPGDVTTARPGIGHYHIGVGVSLPPDRQDHRQGNAVVGAFRRRQVGDRHAADAGRHRLALQIGDDLHNTIAGTCQMITGDGEIGIRITTSGSAGLEIVSNPDTRRPHELEG
jgi:hypothetical protein